MKLITAVIKPDVLDRVKDALKEAGVGGMTMSEVKGFGRQGGGKTMYRGSEAIIDTIPKVEVKMVVTEDAIDRVLTVLVNSARTGHIGDGKIWITDVHRVIRVSTGEEDLDAV